MRKFIDISEHNEFNDYSAIIGSGLECAIIKASEGCTYKDHLFKKHYSNLHGKIRLGAYHMLTATTSPEDQAKEFYDCLEDKQWEVVPVLDIEYDNLSSVAESYATRFIEKFKELSGIKCIIYTGYSYYKDNFSQEFKNNNYFWIASYGTSIKPSANNLVAWQYTENCHDYCFINGQVDCSYLYSDNIFDTSLSAVLGENTDYQNNLCSFSDIKELQHELNIQGFRDKNGNMLEEDGVLGDLTLSALPTIRKGAEGNLTKFIQGKVGVSQDGIFGSLTENAVLTFQHVNNITADGIVGAETWSKLL